MAIILSRLGAKNTEIVSELGFLPYLFRAAGGGYVFRIEILGNALETLEIPVTASNGDLHAVIQGIKNFRAGEFAQHIAVAFRGGKPEGFRGEKAEGFQFALQALFGAAV